MQSVIYKIFNNQADQAVHDEFVKYSKGVFKDRYLVEGKRQKNKWAIKTSAEFANFLVQKCLEKIKGEIQIKGCIISTFPIEEADFQIENVKKYMGIRQTILNTTIAPEKIASFMEKHPKCFYALSFSSKDFDLKIKAKPPKSGKPGKKGEGGPKADFCSLKTTDNTIIEDLFFDSPNFKEIRISHEIEIKEIEIPKNAKTPEEMRENAIRKGTVKRFVNQDEEIKESEKDFSA